jgi:hypothetical protein
MKAYDVISVNIVAATGKASVVEILTRIVLEEYWDANN